MRTDFGMRLWLYRAGGGAHATEWLREYLEGWSDDELDVLGWVVERLELGRERYGPLDLGDGRRWRAEGREELADVLVYAAMASLVEGGGR